MNGPTSKSGPFGAALMMLCCSAALAQEAAPTKEAAPARPFLAYDAATGRDLSTFPPDPLVEYQHMRLAIDIPDMNDPKSGLSAVETLTVRAAAPSVPALTLDAHLLDIKTVAATGRKAQFTNDNRHLTITFDPPLVPGETTEITTVYSVCDPPAGLTWTPESPAWPGRAAQIHSQGESETNSYWFPCHDFPNVRLTTELIVTVPEGYQVSSNGRLVESGPAKSIESMANGAAPVASPGRTTFHWLQDKPHVNYLVSLVVGKFDVVDVSGGGPVPMPVYVPPGQGRLVPGTYGRTPRMIELFGKLTGQPYPWDRYAQVVVWNFGAGGMENTSATTLYDTAVLTPEGLKDGDLDGLISHELAHQWFGDLITCRSWEHIWLNEGFATYFTALWMEHRDGADAYQSAIRGDFDSVLARDKAEAPYAKPMVTHAYTDAGQQFGGAANPYPKGASILHMLRMRLTDEVFFRGIAAYVRHYRLKTAETGDFRRTMEEVSGESLLRFFRQWCERPGVPDLDVTIDYDAAAKEIVVAVKQTQNIDGFNPAFEFDLPIWAWGRDQRAQRLGMMHVGSKETTGRFKVAGEPAFVMVDPDQVVLAEMTIHQPVERWTAQLEHAPAWASRVQAARALSADHSPGATAALVRLVRESRAATSLKVEAVKALRKRRDGSAILEASTSPGLPPDIGVAICEAAADLSSDETLPAQQKARFKDLLSNRAAFDTSQRVRAEALRGLGKIKAADKLGIMVAAAEETSQHDRLRQAAIDALADLDVPAGLAVAIRYSQPGTFNRTRPGAIEAIGKLAHYDREAAYKILAALLSDRESRAWRTAGRVLADLGDARAADDLARLEASKRDDRDKATIREWEERARKKSAPATP